MDRRKFFHNSAIAFGSVLTIPTLLEAAPKPSSKLNLDSWEKVRSQFDLDHRHIQMSQMLLASHPKPVQEAIIKHRQSFDSNPAMYWEEEWIEREKKVTEAAAQYMNASPGEIALTDSTTQGLALLFNGLKIGNDDEIIHTTHDHYVTDMSIKYAAEKNGATVKKIDEFKDPSKVTVDEVVTNISQAISDKTRVVMVTWVQSATGVKLPIKAIADAISDINQKRSKRIYFCVDGVHGFGNQDEDIPGLGCDFFCAGTHKWIFGPRGTGLIWARKDAWHMVAPTIPAFRMNPFLEWLDENIEGEKTFGDYITPGGFHAFDHRYALDAAFEFQMEIGRDPVHQRTTQLNSILKEGIRNMSHVKLHTPIDPSLSAGINCFEIDGLSAEDVVKQFHEKGVIASASPYKESYARLTPCIINTEEEVTKSLEVLETIKV